MVKKTITYENFEGEKVTEEFYFNLTKAEVAMLDLSFNGKLEDYVKQITESQDAEKIVRLFTSIIIAAYGEKTPDGKRFYKTPEMAYYFEHSEPYSVLLEELVTSEGAATSFIQGILPKVEG